MPVYVDKNLVIADDELEWRFTSSGGPGGQHANRANTRVELLWDIAGSPSLTERQRNRLTRRFGETVRVVADDTRSQYRNRTIAMDRLGDLCRDALKAPPKRRTPTKPSRRAKQRRIDAKRQRGRTKKLRQNPTRNDY
ncbi:MAG: alternative ribosome rescue aminoacyl-tRNA hydrolase ArfB [Acidimicrobiia bacterium]|nr:alternative ribosome rescue aminoacyl-tRNA hydrolase ArfB [Acidimicrobiia bacterium]